jgi:hypothetical protein
MTASDDAVDLPATVEVAGSLSDISAPDDLPHPKGQSQLNRYLSHIKKTSGSQRPPRESEEQPHARL